MDPAAPVLRHGGHGRDGVFGNDGGHRGADEAPSCLEVQVATTDLSGFVHHASQLLRIGAEMCPKHPHSACWCAQ